MGDTDGDAMTMPETDAPPSRASRPLPDERYELLTVLGRGGMGEVWLARDRRIDREIAIKMLRGAPDPGSTARFLREARVQGRLEHPSIVPVHDLGGGEHPYFAMKRLSGTTLAEVLAAQARGAVAPWTRRTLLTRFVDICLAIELAHRRGIVHRDLKPANIMLGDFGEAYVLDWGLARVVSGDDDHAMATGDLEGSRSGDAPATEAGALLGTPGYMPPEQIRGEPVDHRADIYALGCVLFEIVAGAPAVATGTAIEDALAASCHRPSMRGDVPPELDEACARATAADPAQRHGSARALADEVQRFLEGDRDLERRRELAEGHADRAKQLLASGDPGRTEALRHAGRAIALDPRNRDAQEVLVRVLVEPPAQIPPAARATMEVDRQHASRAVFRAGAVTYLAFLLMVPIVLVIGGRPSWPLVVVLALLTAQAATCVWAGHRPAVSQRVMAMISSMHIALLTGVGLLIGPLLLVPMLAIGSLAIFVALPIVSTPLSAITLFTLPVAAPLALEWLDVVPRSYQLVDHGLLFRPWGMELSSHALLFAVLAVFAIELVATTGLVLSQRRKQESAEERVHVQRWQLAQLISGPAS